MIRRRHGPVADLIVRELSVERPIFHLAGVVAARDRLTEMGLVAPGWEALADEQTHDQNCWLRKNSMLTNRTASRQAHLRSHSGRNAGVVFSHAPTTVEFTVPPHLFRVLLLERLQLPLPLTEATCNGCHEPLDPLGRHRAACTRSGRIKKRSSPTKRVLARVCREAGARVKFNAFLRDMNLGVRGDDERRIEVLAQDLPCFKGAPLAVDIGRGCSGQRAVAFAESLVETWCQTGGDTPSLAELLSHEPR